MRNITVDNRNLCCIVYNPPDCNGAGWKLNTTKGASGSYRTCTIYNGSPSARLTFNGTAVYYSSAIFNNQSITFRLDGVSTPDVSISQLAVKPANSNASRLVWYKEGLENKGHTLELFPGKNGRTLYVDGIIYTSNSTADTASSATPVRVSAAVDTQTVGIIFGSIIGSISGLILLALIAVMYRRRKELNSVRHQTAAALAPPSHFDYGATQPSHISHFTSEEASEPRLAVASSPIRPLPSVPRETHPRFRTQSLYSHMEDIYEEQLSSSAVHGHSNPMQHPTSSVASASVQQEPQRPRVLALARQANDVAQTYTKLEPLRRAAVRNDKF